MSSAVVEVETTTTLQPSAMMPDSSAESVCSLPARQCTTNHAWLSVLAADNRPHVACTSGH